MKFRRSLLTNELSQQLKQQFAEFVKKEQVKWGDIVRKSGAKID